MRARGGSGRAGQGRVGWGGGGSGRVGWEGVVVPRQDARGVRQGSHTMHGSSVRLTAAEVFDFFWGGSIEGPQLEVNEHWNKYFSCSSRSHFRFSSQAGMTSATTSWWAGTGGCTLGEGGLGWAPTPAATTPSPSPSPS